MILLKRLRAHRGGLVRLKTRLYWYDRYVWDNIPGRICLLLDSGHLPRTSAAAMTPGTPDVQSTNIAAAHLLIDGQPRWVWVVTEDVELINEAG